MKYLDITRWSLIITGSGIAYYGLLNLFGNGDYPILFPVGIGMICLSEIAFRLKPKKLKKAFKVYNQHTQN